ncbi:uncharacterized protein EAF02_006142 [Botrytis sinoallii]|uniref:uncharacterized protein n=1 Tax=Botrytis sinoallii TaxID=1463999 RepID=UPI00190008F8|nr:uncharacterized protein EAF02_006142 [Botrytis sinoallii]KAF7882779.1 hypothetical protein EAF02_006142 [Botrytis sinoallii]
MVLSQRTPKRSSGSKAKKSKKSQSTKVQTERPLAKTSQAPLAKTSQAVKKPWGVDKGTQTTGPPKLTEFTPFPRLPLEVQRQIWRSSFEPTKVELRCGVVRTIPRGQYVPYDYPYEQRSRDRLICMQHKTPPTSRIPIAFVNRESRAETLRHYVRLYQDLHTPEHGPNLVYPCTLYFNPEIDTPIFSANKTQYTFDKIHLSLERLFPAHDPVAVETMKSIRKIEIEFAGSYESNRDSYDLDSCRDALAMFENLEIVQILSTNARPNPSFDAHSFISQYYSREGNGPSWNRKTPVLVRFWSPPDWLFNINKSSDPEAVAQRLRWREEQASR